MEAGPRAMICGRSVVAIVALACAGAAMAQACGDALPGNKQVLEDQRYQIAYRVEPNPVPIGKHFVVDFVVCPRGNAAAPTVVKVDANMPEHRHGMNYRTAVTRSSSGVYRAEGLLFHMPGRWDLTFDIVSGAGTQRLASSLRVE